MSVSWAVWSKDGCSDTCILGTKWTWRNIVISIRQGCYFLFHCDVFMHSVALFHDPLLRFHGLDVALLKGLCHEWNPLKSLSYNLGKNKVEQQTPIPPPLPTPKARMKPRKSQNAPFSHPWFGGFQISHLFYPRLYGRCQRHEIVVTLN